MPESMWVAQQLGQPVVKAFNNIYAQHLRDSGPPPGSPGRIALPVAGDDQAAKATVMALVEDLGFDPVDAGGLEESWRQHPARRSTRPISTPTVYGGRWRRLALSVRQTAARRPTAPVLSPIPPE